MFYMLGYKKILQGFILLVYLFRSIQTILPPHIILAAQMRTSLS